MKTGTLLLALVLSAAPALAEFDREPWRLHHRDSPETIDHGPWAQILERHLSIDTTGLHRFDYESVDREDRALLQSYLEDLQAVRVEELDRPEQMAFWINLYNALTIDVVLRHFPVNSITEIRLGSGNGPWDTPLVEVGGTSLTLNQIEHEILRPIWQDPRIHYAVNCASVGCPNLAEEPFTGENLEDLLDEGAEGFVNHPRAVRFEDGKLILSSLYDWYGSDFGATTREILEHLEIYAEDELADRLIHFEGEVAYDYDWALNLTVP